MASGATSKYALPYPQPADSPNIPGDVQSLAVLLDGLIATAAQGTAASRPAAGKSGRSYYATDTGALSLDTGSAWVTVGIVNTSAGTIAPVTPGAAAAAGGSGQAADAAHVHSAPAFSGTGDITASAPGQAVAAGASGRFADGAHQHAREAWGLLADISVLAFGGSAAIGTSGRVADAAHIHALPAQIIPIGLGMPGGCTVRASTISLILPNALSITGFQAVLGAGSGTVAQLTKNGATIGSASPALSTTAQSTTFAGVAYARGDRLGVTITTAGSSASDLSVSVDAH